MVQCIERITNKIFSNHIWGDVGFIHLALDVCDMEEIKKKLVHQRVGIGADSGNNLDMGAVRVHCVYIEDPDGALIEMVETYSLKLHERLGSSLNIKKFFAKKPIPKIFFKIIHYISK